MKFVINEFKKYKWRYIFFLVMTIGIAHEACVFLFELTHEFPSGVDIFIDISNDPLLICLIIPIAWLLLMCDRFTADNRIDLQKYSITTLIIQNIFVNILAIGILILMSFVVSVIFTGAAIVSISSLRIILFFQAVLLVFLRLLTFSLLILFINALCKKFMIGFLSILLIGIFDLFFYTVFQIDYPFGITPLEHTRVYYTVASQPFVSGAERIPILYSIIYWLCLIVIITLGIQTCRKRGSNSGK